MAAALGRASARLTSSKLRVSPIPSMITPRPTGTSLRSVPGTVSFTNQTK